MTQNHGEEPTTLRAALRLLRISLLVFGAGIGLPLGAWYFIFGKHNLTEVAATLGVSAAAAYVIEMVFLSCLWFASMGGVIGLVAFITATRTVRIVSEIIDGLNQHVEITNRHEKVLDQLRERLQGETPAAPVDGLKEIDAQLEQLRKELTDDTLKRIEKSEERLRGEWRFVAGFIPTIILSALAVAVALVFGITRYGR